LIVLFSISGPKQQVGLKIFKFNTLVSILEELLSFGKVPCNQRFLEPTTSNGETPLAFGQMT
jgi:hypothetical protein